MPTENDKYRAQLDAFMNSSDKSLRTVAEELAADFTDANGRKITKDKVHAYRVGRTKVPDWFLEAMDATYPGWRLEQAEKNGRQISTENTDNTGILRRRLMPVVPSIDETEDMSDAIKKAVSEEGWEGRSVPAPDFFGIRLPLQYVRSSKYAPAFMPGDAVIIDPDAEANLDSLFIIFADGAFSYAALMQVPDGSVAWVKYDGTVIPYDQAMREAALVVHLPQFDEGQDLGAFSRRGLKVGRQVAWPRNPK